MVQRGIYRMLPCSTIRAPRLPLKLRHEARVVGLPLEKENGAGPESPPSRIDPRGALDWHRRGRGSAHVCDNINEPRELALLASKPSAVRSEPSAGSAVRGHIS
jgi:hypothetical protein